MMNLLHDWRTKCALIFGRCVYTYIYYIYVETFCIVEEQGVHLDIVCLYVNLVLEMFLHSALYRLLCYEINI